MPVDLCTTPGRPSARGLVAVLVGLSLAMPAVAEDSDGPLAWVHRDKIRMGWSPSGLEDYDAMAAAGMNAVMPRLELDAATAYDPNMKGTPLSEYDAGIVKALRDSSRKAKEAGLHYFHCLDLAARSQTRHVGFVDNEARFNDGDLPSPVDPVYWQRAVLDRVRRALDFLEGDEYALDAVIIDPEMYTFQGRQPSTPDYGRHAFGAFLEDTGRKAPAEVGSAEERREWLEREGLMAPYAQWQHERIAAQARALRELVHARRPNTILGYIIYRNQTWCNAMAEGLYAPGLPVFIGPETTYSGVMDESFVRYANALRKSVSVPCLFVPGLRMGLEDDRVPTEYLKVVPGNLYGRCQHSEGYWVWAIYRFGEGDQPEQFFAPLRRVNQALDRQARTGEVDASLKPAPLPVELPEDFQATLAAARRLVPAGTDSPRSDEPFIPPKLRGTHTLVLWPSPEGETTLTVRALKLGNLLSATSVRIFGPTGEALWAETIAPGDARVIRVPAVDDGPHAAVIAAGMNAYQIVDATCPAMLCQGAKGVSVNGRGLLGRFYFFVPPDLNHFTIRVNGHVTEHVDYDLAGPDGHVVREWRMLRKPEEVVIENPAPGIWSVLVDKAIDDAGFALAGLPGRFALRAGDLRVEPRQP
jgi:hypothetical protein